MNLELIKKIISENVEKVLSEPIDEAEATGHFNERVSERFLRPNSLIVGYEERGSIGKYIKIGEYVLPESIKQTIKENLKLVENYKFPISKSYGIQITNIIIDKNNINYYSEELKNASKNKNIIIIDEKTDSYGNSIYLIVRENDITTNLPS